MTDKKLEDMLANDWTICLKRGKYLTLKKGSQEILYNRVEKRIVTLYDNDR